MNILSTLGVGSRGQNSAANKPKSQKNDKQQSPRPSKGIEIKSKREIDYMRESSRIVATVLKEIQSLAAAGMTTLDLDAHAEKRIREMGAVPSFKGYCGFPATICASVNNEVVHGIPNRRKVLRRGDVLKVDTGAYFGGIQKRFSWGFLHHHRHW